MSEIEIQINQAIQVTRADGKDDWYVSSIQDLDNKNFCISIPTQGIRPLILHNGDAAKISLISETSRFEFETLVVGQRNDNIPLYILALPKEYKRIQLRDFVRISIMLEMNYAELPEDGKAPVFKRCYSHDLSGGGIGFFLKNNYTADTRLLLKFTLPFRNRKEIIEVMGRVVRSSLVERVKVYHIGVRFVEIGRTQQDLIAHFILTKLAEQNRLR